MPNSQSALFNIEHTADIVLKVIKLKEMAASVVLKVRKDNRVGYWKLLIGECGILTPGRNRYWEFGVIAWTERTLNKKTPFGPLLI